MNSHSDLESCLHKQISNKNEKLALSMIDIMVADLNDTPLNGKFLP